MEAQALIMFGDGLQALFYDDKNVTKNRHNVNIIPMLIAPSEEIKMKYNLEEDDLPYVTDDKKRAIWMEYPVKQVEWLNRSKTGAVIFVHCAFDGKDTAHMRYYEDLLQWDEERDKTEARLRAQVSTLQRELEDVTSVLNEFLRKQRTMASIFDSKQSDTEGGE